jgi:hypothetical protein
MIRIITALFVIALFLACKPSVPTPADASVTADAGAQAPVVDAGTPAPSDGGVTDSGS